MSFPNEICIRYHTEKMMLYQQKNDMLSCRYVSASKGQMKQDSRSKVEKKCLLANLHLILKTKNGVNIRHNQ